MTDTESNTPSEPDKTAETPAATTAPPAAPPAASHSTPDWSGLTTAVDKLSALPDRFINAFREANVPAKPVEPTPPADENKADSAEVKSETKTEPEPAKSKSFSSWWFGNG